MKSRRLLVSLSLLALALSSLTAAAHAGSPFVRAANPVRTADAALATGLVPQRESVAYLSVDEAALAEFRSGDGGTLELPAPDGTTFTLNLTRVDVLAPGATVTFTDDAGPHALTPDVVCFRGSIAGEKDAINGRRLGNFIARHEGRFERGLRFERGEERRLGALWRVRQHKTAGSAVSAGLRQPPTRECQNDSYIETTGKNSQKPPNPHFATLDDEGIDL